MSGAHTATGVCSRHGKKPILSACVSCGQPLCSQCIVRTPVGFKCSTCTSEPEAAPQAKRRRPDPETDERATTWRWFALGAVIVVALGLGAYFLTRSPTHSVRTLGGGPAVSQTTDLPVQFSAASGHQLSGDLLLPPRTASGGAVPGVIIVGDWGAVDRNGMTPSGTFPDTLYADVAQALAAKGVASLRYDPAGQGQSQLSPGSTIKFDDLVTDADGAVKVLAQRVGIDPKRLTVLGHGWGGLVALQLAAQEQLVSKLVLVSTPGRPVVASLGDQLQATAVTPADAQLELQQLQQAAGVLAAGGSLPSPGTLETPLRTILQQGQETYLRAVFALDPTTLAAAAHAPTLIVRGTLDPGINGTDAQLLATALGPQAQVLAVANDTRTLSARASTAPPGAPPGSSATTTTTNPRIGGTPVSFVRDTAAIGDIVDWVLAPPSGSTAGGGAG